MLRRYMKRYTSQLSMQWQGIDQRSSLGHSVEPIPDCRDKCHDNSGNLPVLTDDLPYSFAHDPIAMTILVR